MAQGQLDSCIAFRGVLIPCIVNQYLSHDSRQDGEEMRAVFKLHLFMLCKTQISFVHQGGALQRVIRTLFLQVTVCQPA
jgi:hypothetical protein